MLGRANIGLFLLLLRMGIAFLPPIRQSILRRATSTTTQAVASTSAPPNKVQRIYETWDWRYENRTYKINFRVEGSGPPILLVHGFGANLNHFRFQFPALVAAGYTVYAIDLLGFGASEKPRDARSVGFKIEPVSYTHLTLPTICSV